VRREIGPECSLDAAEIAESVDGARDDSSALGSAMTRVDSERCCCWWNALIGVGRRQDAAWRAMLAEEMAVGRSKDNMVVFSFNTWSI